MPQLIVYGAPQSDGPEDYERSLDLMNHDVESFRGKIDSDKMGLLLKHAIDGKIWLRALSFNGNFEKRPGNNNTSHYEKVEPGDVVLSFAYDHIIHIGEVLFKETNDDIANLVNKKTGEKSDRFPMGIFMREIEQTRISLTDLYVVLEGKLSTRKIGMHFHGWRGYKAKDKKTQAAFDWLERQHGLILQPSPGQPKRSSVANEALEIVGDLERIVLRYERIHQGLLRRYHLGNRQTAPCCFCGEEFPVAFLVCAHIKRYADSEPHEKISVFNTVPACRFGCDELFERSFIYVENARVKVNRSKETTGVLDDKLNNLVERPISYDWEIRKTFFDQHARRALTFPGP